MITVRPLYFIIPLLLAFTIPAIAQEQWKVFGNLFDGRNDFSAIAISDHEVLVIGGYSRSTPALGGIPTQTCEIIDVRDRVIRPAAAMTTARAEFAALLTADSNVVVIG